MRYRKRGARPERRMALSRLAGLAFAMTAAGGCGNVTSGGFGDVQVLVSSDEVEDVQEQAASAILTELGAPSTTSYEESIVGTLSLSLRSFARRGVGDFVELTDGVQEVTLPLDDPAPVEVASRAMPAGRYDAVRTFFGHVEATIESGLVIDGQIIEGPVTVDLGEDGFSTVSYIGFDVWEDAPTVIAIDMQSPVWLRLVDVVLRRVDLDDFRRIFRVRVRQRLLSGG
jgi:hypothetical protein